METGTGTEMGEMICSRQGCGWLAGSFWSSTNACMTVDGEGEGGPEVISREQSAIPGAFTGG